MFAVAVGVLKNRALLSLWRRGFLGLPVGLTARVRIYMCVCVRAHVHMCVYVCVRTHTCVCVSTHAQCTCFVFCPWAYLKILFKK